MPYAHIRRFPLDLLVITGLSPVHLASRLFLNGMVDRLLWLYQVHLRYLHVLDVKLVKHLVESVFLACITHASLYLVYCLESHGRLVGVSDRRAVLVRRYLRRDIFVPVVQPILHLPLNEPGNVALRLAIYQAVVNSGLLFARDERQHRDSNCLRALQGAIDSNRILFHQVL